jgi:predicted dehydrogenase
MLKLAMIGAGGYAYELIKRIWKVPEHIELIAVSSNPTRKSIGRKPCMDRGIPVYADADELLSQVKGKCDVIFVPTPIHTHYSLCKKCVENGFDVFMEKPPVATIQELDSLSQFVKSKGKDVAVTFQALYSEVVQELKKRICAGEFGEVKRLRGMGCWSRDDSYYNRSSWAGQLRIDGNWVLDGTINNPLAHVLADQLYLSTRRQGKMSDPSEVTAELYKGHDIASEDTSSLKIVTSENVEIIFNATLCPNRQVNPFTIIECEDAEIEYQNFSNAEIRFKDGTTENITNQTELRIHMLQVLAEAYRNNKDYAASLDVCRPFTVTVNAAFESSGEIKQIDEKFIKRFEMGESIKTVIDDIDDYLMQVHNQGKLLSEINPKWASSSTKFIVPADYNKFPSKSFKV